MSRRRRIPLNAIGFGPNRTAAGTCIASVQTGLLTLPEYNHLVDLLLRELAAGDLDGPANRLLQAQIDEMTEAVMIGMGLDDPDIVTMRVDLEAVAIMLQHQTACKLSPPQH